eukprot:TRINITY_DN5529_c0_g4_i4.p1 TRINITY_DN5529_c0_g4~~TRINITY_DN5529_c0_g4_i4.p1  ORF type:complete len:155 (-),score=3.25 TRINITY_DN5529_c0_g4_i4:281-745(-)
MIAYGFLFLGLVFNSLNQPPEVFKNCLQEYGLPVLLLDLHHIMTSSFLASFNALAWSFIDFSLGICTLLSSPITYLFGRTWFPYISYILMSEVEPIIAAVPLLCLLLPFGVFSLYVEEYTDAIALFTSAAFFNGLSLVLAVCKLVWLVMWNKWR